MGLSCCRKNGWPNYSPQSLTPAMVGKSSSLCPSAFSSAPLSPSLRLQCPLSFLYSLLSNRPSHSCPYQLSCLSPPTLLPSLPSPFLLPPPPPPHLLLECLYTLQLFKQLLKSVRKTGSQNKIFSFFQPRNMIFHRERDHQLHCALPHYPVVLER